ncbi:MAG: mechanosensitive ion channel family protein [Cyanobacteria bacterium RUI128]|nr:mechanosensitive ion channel family protein [Cyanobacteria bacterium RUI128]
MDILSNIADFFQTNSELLSQIVVHFAVLVVVMYVIDNAVVNIKQRIYENTNNSSLFNLLLFMSKFVKVIVIILILGSFLQCRGYSLTSLITGLGITGLAVGLAAKEMLASVLGSISIMTDRVYKIGDYVSINNVEGIVEAVNFRSTKIRTISNTLITIPNNITADTIVHNRSESEFFRLIETFDIEYDTTDEKIEEGLNILRDIAQQDEDIQNNYLARISALGENSIKLQLIANTTTNNWMTFLAIKDRLYKTVLKRFRENGLSFAFPSRTIYVRKNED